MIPNKSVLFSTYLKTSVVILVTGSVVLISIVLFFYFGRRLEAEFEKNILAQKGQAEMILEHRLANIKQNVTTLSTDNSLRVTIMMNDTTKLEERAREFYADIPGVSFYIKRQGQERIYPQVHPGLSDQILRLAGTKPVRGEIIEENGKTSLLWCFEAPIMHKEERMGDAFAIYDMLQDKELVNIFNRTIHDNILISKTDKLVGFIRDATIPLNETSLGAISKGSGFIQMDPDWVLIPLDGFQNLYFSASRKDLSVEKRNIALFIGLFTFSVLTVSVVSSVILSKRLTQPLSKMANKAYLISRGVEGISFKIASEDCTEFQRLSQVFNDMLIKLKDMEEKTRYTELMENVDDAVYLVDSQGKIIQANDATCVQLGYHIKALLNLDHDTILPKNDARIIRNLLNADPLDSNQDQIPANTTIETFHIAREGDPVPVEIKARAIMYRGRKVVLNVSRNIRARKAAEREKKQLEAQLLHAQKMEAIGTLAGGVAHDFNNLLQVIQGYTELLVAMKDKNDPELKQLQEIKNASQRASELTDQLLTFSRKTESSTMPVNLNDEVEQGCRHLNRTLPSTIETEHALADDLMMITADPGQIQQVIMNLGVNARDAMPEGGRLVIETKNVFLDETHFKKYLEATPGDYVRLSVTDSGQGMDEETIKHIFEPFFTTKTTGKGTGLGLWIVYGIVRDRGGFITCYSKIDIGTTFKIYFPAIKQKAKQKKRSMPSIKDNPSTKNPQVSSNDQMSVVNNPKLKGSETILLVDDEERIRNLGVALLSQCGYAVLTAANGIEALSVYQARQKEIDLVILDLIMPEMDGHKCFQKLKSMDPEINVIISSGYSVTGSSQDFKSEGVKAFIDKPYEFQEMMETIRNTLDKALV